MYQYLQKAKGFAGFSPAHQLTPVLEGMLAQKDPNYKNAPDIKWNFTKFLVDRDGNVVDRFAPVKTPADLDAEIAKLL